MRDESHLQDALSNLEAGSAERQVPRQFRKQRLALWAAGPRARSVPYCHGVLALRHRPWTRAVPDESHLQDAASNLEAVSADWQVQAMFEASF